jgi:hypothetical protein
MKTFLTSLLIQMYTRLRNKRPDAIGHFIVGFAIVIAAVTLQQSLMIAFWASVAAGALKEIWDYFHRENHDPDFVDFAITVLGGGVSTALVWIIWDQLLSFLVGS